MQLNVRDFSRTPSGRFRSDGPDSGETYRQDILIPALNTNEHVVVNLDGAAGYPSSFLDEVFGGLIKRNRLSFSDIRRRLVIEANEPELERYVPLAWSFMERAAHAST